MALSDQEHETSRWVFCCSSGCQQKPLNHSSNRKVCLSHPRSADDTWWMLLKSGKGGEGAEKKHKKHGGCPRCCCACSLCLYAEQWLCHPFKAKKPQLFCSYTDNSIRASLKGGNASTLIISFDLCSKQPTASAYVLHVNNTSVQMAGAPTKIQTGTQSAASGWHRGILSQL